MAVIETKLQKIYDREGRNTSSRDPKLMNARVFLGNFPAEGMERKEVEEIFNLFGKVLGISLHKTYGFVQFDDEDNAKAAVTEWHGKILKGQKLDVNIATERRKEPSESQTHHSSEGDGRYSHRGQYSRPDRGGHGGRRMSDEQFDYFEREKRVDRAKWPPPPPRRSPSPGRFEFEMRMRHLELDRRGGPRFRDDYDPYYDNFDRPSRDSYSRPRDDPFERYDDERTPRDFHPRHGPPPRERIREPIPDSILDYPRDLYRSPPEERREPPPVGRSGFPPSLRSEQRANEKPLDMQIIVVNKQQKEYASHVRSRFYGLGINVELLHLSPTVSLANALDTAAESGLLYAVIISNQNEMHRSVTLTILHGRNPQEHKNMPLDDALGLVDRDFERYYIDVREGNVVPQQHRHSKNDITALLSKVASGDQLRADQIDVVINTLQKQKEATGSGISNALMGRMGHHLGSIQAGAESKESIQNQQADLQAKILSLLGSSAVVPSGNSSQTIGKKMDMYSQGSSRGPGSHNSQSSGSQYWPYGLSGSGSKW